ncbi:MAG: PQQ-dependent sugar dehydrogenase, partial [Fibrobacteria bacterium]
MELARFNVADGTLASKKVIMRYPRAKDDDHHGAGGMSFTDAGVLVIGTGDNSDPHDATNNGYGPFNSSRAAADASRTSANSDDLRGKILRIKPKAFADSESPAPGAGTTYDIPAGNLWEVINDKTKNPNWDATDDISKVRKEIFSMGHRNPYHVRVDSKSGWLFWGEVGPDAGSTSSTRGPAGHDEWNLAMKPGFYGHPFCNGYNVPYNKMTGTGTYGEKYDCAATVNNSPNNTGIKHMPPAVAAIAAYASGSNSTDDDPRFNSGTDWGSIRHDAETAIGGPMYRYDPSSTSATRFPPWWEGKILFFDWSRRNFRIIELQPDGTLPKGNTAVQNFAPSGLTAGSYIDMQFGPDGAMYLLKNCNNGYSDATGAQLFKVEYTGAQDKDCYIPFTPTTYGPDGTTTVVRPAMRKQLAPVSVKGFYTLPAGYRNLSLYDLSGRKVWSYHREDADAAASVRLPSEIGNGLWQADVMP